MNKKLLSLAVAAGLASSSAMAVDLNAGTGSNSYASESTISSAGTNLTAAAANNVTVNAGFSISDSTERYMRFDITGATLGSTGLALAVDDSSGAGNALEVQSAGGALGDTYVIYEVTASGAQTVGTTNDAVLTMPNLTVTANGAIGVTYALFSNAIDAVNNTTANALVTNSGTVAGVAAGTSVGNVTGATTPAKIDVTEGAAKFVAGGGFTTTTNSVGTISLADTAGTQAQTDGATDTTHAVATASGSLVVTGDFTATQDLTSLVPDGTYTLATAVFLDQTGADCTNNDDPADALTDTTATWTTFGAAAGDSVVCIKVNGVGTIAAESYSAVYTPVANTGYTLAATSLNLATLAKNGSTTVLNLALSPTGAYPSFIRVNNTSNIAGDVTITLINDDGDSSAFNLGDVSGQTSSALAGQASTGLLSIADLMAAAQAADATFDLGANSNKLRASISGEFSSIAAQSITTSIDGNSFTTF